MTKRDFLRLLSKLLGIVIFISSVTGICYFLAFAFDTRDLVPFAWASILMIVILGVISLLIFFPDRVIDILKLDKGFDDNQVNIGKIDMIKLIGGTVLITGGLSILDSFPSLFVAIAYKVQESVSSSPIAFLSNNLDNTNLYINSIKLIAGYLLITNYNRIAQFLFAKNNQNEA